MTEELTATPSHHHEIASLGIRKVLVHVDEVHAEGAVGVERPLRRAVACVVFRNPWAGQGFVEDLWEEMNRVGRIVSLELVARVLEVMGGDPDAIHGFGKCALVGLDGETEHGAAIIHCPGFGPHIRERLNATAGISSIERRCAAGVSIAIPMNHKTQRATRSHYQAVDFGLHDAPHPHELAIALAVTSGPRPHARIGDLSTDAQRRTPDFGAVPAPQS